MEISRWFKTETDPLIITVRNPPEKHIGSLKYLFSFVDKVRDKFGPIYVTSGLRPKKSYFSQHEVGQAGDIVPKYPRIQEVFRWIVRNLPFDQIIMERDAKDNRWIHYSLKESGNRQSAWIGMWSVRKQKMVYRKLRCVGETTGKIRLKRH